MKRILCAILFVALTVVMTGRAHANALASGTTITGVIPASGGTVTHTFTASAGQYYAIFVSAGFDIRIVVHKPDGSTWANTDRSRNEVEQTGTYTVVLSALSSAQSGSYTLHYVRGDDSVANGALTSGQSLNSALGDNGIASYTFSGKTEQYFSIHSTSGYDIRMVVLRPDGSVFTNHPRRVEGSLDQDGAYTLLAFFNSRANTGGYALHYVRGDDSVSDGTLINASTRSGTLQVNGIASYKFSGMSGNSAVVTSSGAYTRTLDIYNPDGSHLAGTTDSLSANLDETGDHTLVLTGGAPTDEGSYTVTVTTVPAVAAEAAEVKPEKSGVDMPQEICSNGAAPSDMVGNPVNFGLGYKKQTETDYNGGRLALTRIYRSDSTWTDNTFGERWRHNYARTLDVTGATASITDGTGAKTEYTLSGGNWVPDDSDITAKFETVTGGYVYTLPDNTREIYNSSKKLVRIEYLGGGSLDLTYNGSSLLETVADENGRELEFTYSGGLVDSVVTPEGTFGYGYDGSGNLVEVTKPDTTTREYHYEDTAFPHALTGITDENAVRYATYDYNTQGKAVLSKHAGDVDSYEIAYNADGSTTVTNPLGKDTTYHFTTIQGLRRIVQVDGHASTNCAASNRYYNYDNNGWLMGKTDWENNKTVYVRDSRGLITQMIEAQGTPKERVTSTTYDSSFNLPDVVTVDKLKTDYDYDAHGRMTSIAATDTATSQTRTTAYTYYANTTDPNGNLILGRVDTVTYPNGAVTKYTYNSNRLVETVTRAYGQIYAQTSTYTYDAAKRIASVTDPNGIVTAFTYDTLGRLLTSTLAYGTASAAVTTYAYYPDGTLNYVIRADATSLVYTYDDAHRLETVTSGTGSGSVSVLSYTYDDAGNITQETRARQGQSAVYTQARGYDELSRLLSVTDVGTDMSYAYDKNSNVTQATDGNSHATDYAYDALERLTRITDALSGETDAAYNPLDDVTTVTDARENATNYTHNAFGEVLTESSPDRGLTAYEYNASGMVVERVDARGKVTEYDYDLLNRLTAITYPTDSGNDAAYTYDVAGYCTYGLGRVCRMEDAGGITDYGYDLYGHVNYVREDRGGGLVYESAYLYDGVGNLYAILLPGGRQVVYGFDSHGNVNAVSMGYAPVFSYVAGDGVYLPFGGLEGLTYGNALVLSNSYNSAYQLTNRSVSGGVMNVDYVYDMAGNVVERGSVVYGYDALNRLDEEDAVAYTYDSVSNRLTKTGTSYTIPSTSNKMSAAGASSLTYDAAGNITDDGTNTYAWDDAGRLSSVNTTGGVYIYNASNQRVKKTVGGTTTQYIYGADGLLYGEYDGESLIREYIYLNGEPLAQITGGTPEVITYLHTDNLGTPRAGTDSTGTQVWAWNSDAFGNGSPTGTATVNLRMPGQYYDAESGLHYNWNRYYNPSIGRYISSDPIGLEGGINTFLYANANPVRYTDPRGLTAIPSEVGMWSCTAGPNPVCIASTAVTCTKWVITAIIAGTVYMACADGNCTADTGDKKEEKPSAQECAAQWEEAMEMCEDLIDSGEGKGITGGYDTPRECARGLVSQACGGNAVNR